MDPVVALYRASGGSAGGRREALARYAFAVPSDHVLALIRSFSPGGVVELGAGTGYWAWLLTQYGVDVVAIDRAPPPSPDNPWFSQAERWFPVRQGDVDAVDRHAGRSLLMIWPTANEAWPAAAVRRFHRAGGRTVLYIGEEPGGQTGDDEFHRVLGAMDGCAQCRYGVLDRPCVCAIEPLFEVVQAADLPQWEGCADRLLVHRRVDPNTRSGASSWRRRPSRGRRRP